MATIPTPAAASSPPAPYPGPRREAAILGSGAFLPDTMLGNAELETMVDTSDAWILERTGIRERRRAGAGETASAMGAEAARRALRAAGEPSVDAVIVATCSGDSVLPSTACLVQRRLGLTGVPAFDIGAACSGYVYAVATARALIRSGTAATVLVVAAEAMTTLVDYGDRSTCVLFGDGAGASVVGAVSEGGISAVRWGADGREADLIYYGPKVGDAAGGNGLRMYGKGTFRIAVERMTEVAELLCHDAGWAPADVDLLVPHQANLRIIEAVAKRLAVPLERVMVDIDRFGNTSAASIPIALAEAEAAGRLHAGDRVMCVAFGSGTTWGGLALRWNAPATG
jgi:3-oxoacyl-[acyl-carrier-protein] synthase-3